jgi:hypothetical protein
MKVPYPKSVIAGSVLGLLGLYVVGCGTLLDDDWSQHFLGVSGTGVENLRYQAFVLRVCRVFLNHGLIYFIVPILTCVGLAKLWDQAESAEISQFWRQVGWCFTTLCAAIFLIMGLNMIALTEFVTRAWTLQDWANLVGMWIYSTAVSVLGATVCGTLPGISLAAALLLKGWRLGRDFQKNRMNLTRPESSQNKSSVEVIECQQSDAIVPLPAVKLQDVPKAE